MKFNEKHEYVFYPGERDAFRIRDHTSVVEWIEANFRLTTAYAVQGNVRLFKWQREPADAILKYDEVIFIAPVQTGKSMIGEGVTGYMIDNDTMNAMIVYSKKEVVADVFDERLKPFVREVPAIRKYWSGEEDDLTKRRIKLAHMILRIASAGVRGDIATHNAGFIYGVELAKWPDKDFDPVKMLFGRTQASRMMGKRVRVLFETSPIYDGDKSFVEAHKPGTLYLKPYYPCPHCGQHIEMVDNQVMERPNRHGQKDHDPERIRATQAAFLECKHCKGEITDEHRIEMNEGIVWAAPAVKRGQLVQRAETIVRVKNVDANGVEDGTESVIVKGRRQARRVVFNWNRFVDVTWTFAECLACYFESLNSPNPDALRTYRNEDMADWVKLSANRLEDSFIASKKQRYSQYGADAYVPDGVRVMLLGCDTQDNGFYFVIRGFGLNMESWLVREGFILCQMNESEFTNNPGAVFNRFTEELHRFPLVKKDGSPMPIAFGVIDRGGHRAADVDYIVTHMHNMVPYIGTPAKNAPITVAKNGRLWGHTENLSRMVQTQMESQIWHLPKDVSTEYTHQVLNQYVESYTDTRGHTKKRWVSKDPDHLRDCENYICALLQWDQLGVQAHLFDESAARQAEKLLRGPTAEEIAKKEMEKKGDPVAAGRRDRLGGKHFGGFLDELGGF